MGYEIFNGIFGEIPHHFLMQLPRKGLVMAHDQGWNVEVLDDVGHGERLSTARHAKHHASFLSIFQLRNQIFNCFWLVSTRLKLGVQPKAFHAWAQGFQSRTIKRFREVKGIAFSEVDLEQRLVRYGLE